METLRFGTTRRGVALWQKFLNLESDGDFGPLTEEATEEWQEAMELEPDGIVGNKSWEAAFKNLLERV